MQNAEADFANDILVVGDDARMFDELYENFLPEVFIFHLKSFTFIATNHITRLNAGYSKEQPGNRIPANLEQEFDLRTLQNLRDSLLRGECGHTLFNTYICYKDGALYPADTNLRLFSYEEGYRRAMVFDLSKCEQLESEIEENETTLNAVLNVARDAVVMLNCDGQVSFWNTAAEQLFGFSREEIIGKELHRMVATDRQQEAYRTAIKNFQSTGKGKSVGKIIELKANHKDGREIDIELSVSALKVHDTWHAVGIVRDISERIQAKKALEESRQAFLALAEDAPIGILSCDNQGNIQYINQMTLDIIGSPSLEESKKINLLSFPALVEYGFSRKLSECLQKNISTTQEMSYVSKWGKHVWMRVHVKPQVKGNNVIGAQIIIDDISQTKQLEEKLFHLSVMDTLTDAYNRRYMISKMEEQIECAKDGGKFSVIMMDIDHFKNINDCFGHSTGDWVLRQVTEEMLEKIRKRDILARWGGDEFMLLLPETDVDQAAIVADELRVCLSKMNFSGVGQVTASFGIVGCSSVGTVDTIAQTADRMMYKAKFAGRNCVRCTLD